MTTVKLSPIVVIGTALLGFSIVAVTMEGPRRSGTVPSPVEALERVLDVAADAPAELTLCEQLVPVIKDGCGFSQMPLEDSFKRVRMFRLGGPCATMMSDPGKSAAGELVHFSSQATGHRCCT